MTRNENRYCPGIEKEAPYTLKQESLSFSLRLGGRRWEMVKSYTLARRPIQREQKESKDVSELSQSSRLEQKEEEEDTYTLY